MSLANDYRPKTFDDVTEQKLVVHILENLCKTEPLNFRNFLFVGPAGCGKAQPLTSLVLTPDKGYRKMSDIHEGDKVVDGEGKITKVKAVFPQGKRLVFRIYLCDGTSFEVADNHLNPVIIHDMTTGRKSDTILDTVQLLSTFKEKSDHVRVCVPMHEIDCWCDDRWFDIVGNCSIGKVMTNLDWSASNIPLKYLHTASTTRHHILAGILQKPIKPHQKYNYTTKFKNLAEYMVSAGRSLGYLCTLDTNDGEYHVKIDTGDVDRYITDIEYIGLKDCQCIYVESDCHTYFTDNYTITHNTTLCRCVANTLNENKGGLIEIDAASYSGVDRIREIVQDAQKYPVGTKYKVYIIDEVHALSSAAFQALLKCLEESPAKTVFMLATTNPEKIPNTILSRVQIFQLSKISVDGIFSRMKHILDTEIMNGDTIQYEDAALNFIAKKANGGMRDALTLLDKVLAYSKDITSESVVDAIGLGQYDDYFALLGAISKKDNVKITDIIDTVYNSGVNFTKWFEEFHSFVINVIKYIYLRDMSRTMIPANYESKMSSYGQPHATICQGLSTRLVPMIHELKSSQYQQEIAITYLCSKPKKESAS